MRRFGPGPLAVRVRLDRVDEHVVLVDPDVPELQPGLGQPEYAIGARVVEPLRAAEHRVDLCRGLRRRLDLEGVVLARLGVGRVRCLADREDVHTAGVRGVGVRHEPDLVAVEVVSTAVGDRAGRDGEAAGRHGIRGQQLR